MILKMNDSFRMIIFGVARLKWFKRYAAHWWQGRSRLPTRAARTSMTWKPETVFFTFI